MVTLLVACAVLGCVAALAFRTGFRITGPFRVIAAIVTLMWGLWMGAVLLA